MKSQRGTTLIEVLVGTAIIGLVFSFAITAFMLSADKLTRSKIRILAAALANEQMEIIRNLPFDQVGTQGGSPSGNLPQNQQIVRSNITFSVAIIVDWVDDPFDGQIPADTTPTDYKKVEVVISWANSGSANVKLTSNFSPKGVEAAANTGSILISVFDASGLPVSQADITLTNNNLSPAINLTRQTDDSGNYQFIGYPPDLNNYHIAVTKGGYTLDQTYPVSAENPNPIKPDISVIANEVTSSSFAIDRVSSLAVATQNATCQAIGNIGFNLKGQALIGNPPPNPVLKYDEDHTTDAAGNKTISNLGWDNYMLTLLGTSRNITGIIPPTSLNVLPNTNANLTLVLSDSYSTDSLLANVKDANTNLPISGASVRLVYGTYDETKITGQGAWLQTDWNGGSGQALFTDATKYFEDNGAVEVNATPGQVSMIKSTSNPNLAESFDSDANKDATASNAVWDTSAGEIRLPQTGGVYDFNATAQSLQLTTPAGKIVSATLTVDEELNGQTVRYYLSADGASFEAVTPGNLHNFVQTGGDLRFRVEFSTTDQNQTPVVRSLGIALTIETYANSGSLTSSTFDTGSASSFIMLNWNPENQPSEVGSESVRFQLAANDDNATWDFVGPDGTAGTYYTVSGTPIAGALQNKRYIRYKLFLQTADVKYSPAISGVSIDYTSGCTPPGQAFFGGLSSATTYQVTIQKSGYVDLVVDVDISGNLQNTFQLTPN
jgi:prepilin-type N-terminal cleavage/methylation domain-containing protein